MNDEEKRKLVEQADSKNPTEIVEGKSNLGNFQVIRKEYSSHKFDANIGLNLSKGEISFNTACIKFYEDTNHVQILVDEKDRIVAIRKCGQYDKDAMQWARNQKKDGKRVSRPIKTDIGVGRIYENMNWVEDDRYKVLGTRKLYEDADLVMFMLDEAERFETTYVVGEDGKKVRKVNSFLPAQWKDSFGDFVEEHDRKQTEGVIETVKLFNTSDGQSYFVQPKSRKDDESATDSGTANDKSNPGNVGGNDSEGTGINL